MFLWLEPLAKKHLTLKASWVEIAVATILQVGEQGVHQVRAGAPS